MITVNSDTPYLGISFAEVLDIDTIQNLKEGFPRGADTIELRSPVFPLLKVCECRQR